jgi:2-dehydropantoate 2-reductase
MKEIRKALVVGAGAIGAAVASRIFDSDPESVAILASGERAERYAREGILVNGRRYHFALANPAVEGPYDLVLIAVKDYHLSSAIEEMRPFVGPETLVLSLLNGITSEEMLRTALEPILTKERNPLAFMIGIDALRENGEISFLSIGEIRFGDEKNNPHALSPNVSAISRFLSSHGVPHAIPEDMVKAMWYKFMLNVALNQWSAVLKAPYGFFQRSESARKLLSSTMEEVVKLSQACGTGLESRDVEAVFATLAKLDPAGKTSMLQDIEAGRQTEVEIFAHVVAEKSRSLGIFAPVNEALCLAIRALEQNADLSDRP